MFVRFQFALLAACLVLGACAATPQPLVPDRSVNPGYHVVGNQVLDKDGNVHLFHGVARPSMEWSATGENITKTDFQLMAGWRTNVVRIALNQDYWLPGANGAGAASYQENVLQAVEWAKQAGMDVILDLHWSDKGDLHISKADQQQMADVNSITFWQSVADTYKDDGRVLFELYNEPETISWDVWQNGGTVTSGFTAVGMQQLYDAVRSSGATNIVIVGGIDWAYDLSGVPTHLIQGENIMYATHPYDYGNKQPSDWDRAWGFLTATAPVIATEFGSHDCSTSYTSQLIQYADAHGASWTGWAWYVNGCGFPSLITDWSGTPSAPGQVVKDALATY
jgi:hypothetical protein